MEIKLATYEDLDDVISIVKQYRTFYEVHDQNVEDIKQFMAERLSNHDSKVFIAVKGQEVVGFIQLYPSFSTVSLKPQWILNDFFVSPLERQKGCGSALMSAVINHFKTSAKGFILVTDKTNTIASKFYKKHGWKTDEYDFYTYFY